MWEGYKVTLHGDTKPSSYLPFSVVAVVVVAGGDVVNGSNEGGEEGTRHKTNMEEKQVGE